MRTTAIGSRLSGNQAARMIGSVVRLAPGMPTALGLEDELAEGESGIVLNARFSESGWPHFTVGFGDLIYEGLLEFEFQRIAERRQ